MKEMYDAIRSDTEIRQGLEQQVRETIAVNNWPIDVEN